MFHPTLELRSLSDSELESRINDVTLKINQAYRMNNRNFYEQLVAINNSLQLELEQRKMQHKKDSDSDSDSDSGSEFDNLINVK
jgi:hypothetical protein|tara:strand:- start:1266 stop:1517 length:252 start_codon:yes stop_codon:yes gene_type:complete